MRGKGHRTSNRSPPSHVTTTAPERLEHISIAKDVLVSQVCPLIEAHEGLQRDETTLMKKSAKTRRAKYRRDTSASSCCESILTNATSHNRNRRRILSSWHSNNQQISILSIGILNWYWTRSDCAECQTHFLFKMLGASTKSRKPGSWSRGFHLAELRF